MGMFKTPEERAAEAAARARREQLAAEVRAAITPANVPGMKQEGSMGSNQIVCPHCQVKGKVTSRVVKQKRGLSGGKVTGAVFTAGVSMFATGLSRKEKVTEMRCGNCQTVWHVA